MTTIIAQCPSPPPSPPPLPMSPPPTPPPVTYGAGVFFNTQTNQVEIQCSSSRRLDEVVEEEPLALTASGGDEHAELREMMSAFLAEHQTDLRPDQVANLAANLADWMGGEPDFGQPALA